MQVSDFPWLIRRMLTLAVVRSDLGAGSNRKKFPTAPPSISNAYLCRHSGDPLIHYGRHFGRTVHSMCNVKSLLTNGMLRMGEADGGEVLEEFLTTESALLLLKPTALYSPPTFSVQGSC